VDSSGLKPWQAKRIAAALGPAVGYRYRLRRRMEVRGFPPQDPLYQLVMQAYKALHHLYIELHYRSCNGVGRLMPGAGLLGNAPAPDHPPIGTDDRKDQLATRFQQRGG
jgi:hypothetical protein